MTAPLSSEDIKMLRSKEGLLLLCAACVLTVSMAASAADQGRASDARKIYMEDREFCLSGKASQDRQTCLREAGAALQEAKQGQLADPQTTFEQNKFARCDYHKVPADREYCERRMRGEGTTSGSVEDGGILRELVVVVPAS